jgi:hypothetical protein
VAHHPHFHATPHWYQGVVIAVTALVVGLSYQPARNLLSRQQIMNTTFDPFHLVNTYGAFGSITRQRQEVVLQGTSAAAIESGTTWREYEFKGKPGDPRRRPPQVAPYHLRLDWLMWFVPLSPRYGSTWLPGLLAKLLVNDRDLLRLLRTNPFPNEPPVHVRVVLYRYRYTSWRERRSTGAWWTRAFVSELIAPVSLDRLRSRR